MYTFPFWRFAFVFSLLAVTVGSLLPGDSVSMPANDKLVHGLAYALLTFGWCCSRTHFSLRSAIGVGVGLWGWGVAIEVAQNYVPNRFGGWDDVLANSLGIIAGALLYTLWQQRWRWRWTLRVN